MLGLSKKGDYAIRGMIYLARQPEGSVSLLTDIAREVLAPKTFLAKILQSLTKLNFIYSTRGVGGGFSIARPPDKITLLEIIEAIEGPINPNRCITRDGYCEFENTCKVHPVWYTLQNSIRTTLEKITLEDVK
jgi:Rrf2 family protein